jgi:hypothetical protein
VGSVRRHGSIGADSSPGNEEHEDGEENPGSCRQRNVCFMGPRGCWVGRCIQSVAREPDSKPGHGGYDQCYYGFSSLSHRQKQISFQSALLPLNQIPSQNPEVSMFGAMQFDFPIRRPNNRFVGNSIRVAAVRALLTAHRTRLVRASVDMNHARHWPDYTADAGSTNWIKQICRANSPSCSSSEDRELAKPIAKMARLELLLVRMVVSPHAMCGSARRNCE